MVITGAGKHNLLLDAKGNLGGQMQTGRTKLDKADKASKPMEITGRMAAHRGQDKPMIES